MLRKWSSARGRELADNFMKMVHEADTAAEREEMINRYVGLFQEVKYRLPAESVIILLKLAPVFDDKFMVYYHLFNHFLMMKLGDEAEKLVEGLMQERERVREMSVKYPFAAEFGDNLVRYFESGETEKIYAFIKDSSEKERSEAGKRYFELSMKLRDAGIENISDAYFSSAISYSEGRARSKIILSYCRGLEKRGMKEKAKSILSSEINNASDEDSLPMMYKLAVMFEAENPEKALAIYSEMEKIDYDYMDVKEKISKLTNYKNKYKIDKLTEESRKDDSNIHF